MKVVPSVVRTCISAGVALAALAPRAGLAADQFCPGGGMAMFEDDENISALDTDGNWLRLLPDSEMLVTMTAVDNLPLCADSSFRVSPDGTHLIAWAYDDEILSVTADGTELTKLPEGQRLWAADVTFLPNGRAVFAALLSRDMEEPRLAFFSNTFPGEGVFAAPYEVTGADCGAGTMAVGTSIEGVVMALCAGSFTQFSLYDTSFSVSTFPLDLPDRELLVAKADPQPDAGVAFFAIAKDLQDKVDPVYELVRIRLSPDGTQQFDLVIDNVAYAGGDHGLAVLNERNAVYMDEQGLTQVLLRRHDVWSAAVIHPLRPEAKLSARTNPQRVLISEYDVEMLTLTSMGWEKTTLFSVGAPPAAPPGEEQEEEGDGGCSAAGAGPATGLAQALLVMMALALATRLARRRIAAHAVAACPPSRSGR